MLNLKYQHLKAGYFEKFAFWGSYEFTVDYFLVEVRPYKFIWQEIPINVI